MDWGTYQGYFPKPFKSLFIADKLEDNVAEKREFAREGLNLNYVDCSRYLGSFLGPREELEEWLRPKVEAWANGIRTLAKISKR